MKQIPVTKKWHLGSRPIVKPNHIWDNLSFSLINYWPSSMFFLIRTGNRSWNSKFILHLMTFSERAIHFLKKLSWTRTSTNAENVFILALC